MIIKRKPFKVKNDNGTYYIFYYIDKISIFVHQINNFNRIGHENSQLLWKEKTGDEIIKDIENAADIVRGK